MIQSVQAFPSCDQVFVVWRVEQMIPNCAGFAVFRQAEGQDAEPLETWVGFEDQHAAGAAPIAPGTHRPSTEWPVQKMSWTDYEAPQTGSVCYGVAPVVMTGPTTLGTVKENDIVWGLPVSLEPADDAPVSGWFNRGTISAQWLVRALAGNAGGAGETAPKKLADIIDTPGDAIRNFLAGRAREELVKRLDIAIGDPGRHIYAALFELDDKELKGKLKALGPRAHIVLGNSDGTDSNNTVHTNASAAELKQANVDIVRRAIAPARFAHNKFVVFTDPHGEPERVWTGSINWTETGVCTQNSNSLDIFDADAARAFKAHWQTVHDAESTPVTPEAAPHSFALGAAQAKVWFTPVQSRVDLIDAGALINGAKEGVLFLMLNPGPAGLLGPIIERLSKLDAHYDPDLYVRGVLNNFPNREKGADADKISLLTSAGSRQDFTDDDLKGVMKPTAVGTGADWWQKELASSGKFNIAVHSKVIVIDPSGDNPIVMTGSHNFSDRASSKNDDNLVIVQGDRALAQAYAVNVIGIYNEYRWRAWRNTPAGQADHGLKRSSDWLSSRIGQAWYERETRFWLGA